MLNSAKLSIFFALKYIKGIMILYNLFCVIYRHPSHGKKVTCPTCIKTFTVRQFKRHMDSHIEAPPFCKLCQVKYQVILHLCSWEF